MYLKIGLWSGCPVWTDLHIFARCCRYISSSSARSFTGVGITRESFSMTARARSLKISASAEPGACTTTGLSSVHRPDHRAPGTNLNSVPASPNAGMTARSNASSPSWYEPASPVSPACQPLRAGNIVRRIDAHEPAGAINRSPWQNPRGWASRTPAHHIAQHIVIATSMW